MGRRLLLAVALALPLAAPVWAAGLAVELAGLSREQQANVEAFLSIYQERDTQDPLESRVRLLHARAPAEIREALAPFGLYRVQVRDVLERTEDGGWLARYEVEPGDPVPLGQIDVQVTGEGSAEPGRPDLGLESGQPLSHAAYESAKKRLKTFAESRGYLEARFERSEVVVDPDAYRADVFLHLDSGPRFYVGEVRLLQEGFAPEFLQRYVDFSAGDPFRYTDLLDLQGALYNTDYFSHVQVTPGLGEVTDRRVPVDVELERKKPNRYRFGAGYATDTGPRLVFDWTRRYLGRWGHSANALLLLSPVQQTLEAGYRIPLAEPRREFLTFHTRLERYDTTSREGTLLSLRASHNDFYGDWQRILGVDYDFESPRTEGDDATFTLVPNASWIWKVQDDPLYTRRGFRLDFTVLGAAEPVLSNATFLQGRVRGKGIYTPRDRWRLLGRAEVGATLADSVRDVPVSRRFYAGGDNSVRGYKYEELSPRDEQGERTGGRYLATASLELERRLTDKWSVAAFYDTGNAFDDLGSADLQQGAGVGVRWLSPVGLLRVDVAQALEDGSFRLHLVIGPDL